MQPNVVASLHRLHIRLSTRLTPDIFRRFLFLASFASFDAFYSSFHLSITSKLLHYIMDPLSALSLAGNIIQFIDFGGRLLSNARELYKSSVGSLAIHDEIVLITTDLETLIKKLRLSICESLGSEENEDQWQSLRKICDEAATVAEELLRRLETLKLNCGNKSRVWASLQLAVRSLWNEKEITSLSDRLATLKEALKTHLFFSLRLVMAFCRLFTGSL